MNLIISIVKDNALKILAFLITFLAVFTVNSTCYTLLGEEEEPESLERFKKYK